MMWVNLGGLALSIILLVEMAACIGLCCLAKGPDQMMNMLCFVVAGGRGDGSVVFFWAYRFFAHYFFMILISVFAAVDFESFSVPPYEHRNSVTFGNEFD